MSESSDAWEALQQLKETPEYQRKIKYVRGHYLCTVNPGKRKVFNFRKGKQVKLKRWGSPRDGGAYVKGEQFPMMGYVCPTCRVFGSDLRHYRVEKISICEDCAIKKVFP